MSFCFGKGSGSKAAVAGFVDFYTLAVLAKPIDKALTFMISAPSATTHKAYPPASVMLNKCKRGEYYDYISTTCMACPRGKFSNTINHNIENYEGDCISCSPGSMHPAKTRQSVSNAQVVDIKRLMGSIFVNLVS